MGCFWGSEEVFRKIKGVTNTAVGFMGGKAKNPTYLSVCTNLTGHVEVVQATFNPKIISYEKLLEYFWKNHDPTTPNRQGLDFGTQYKSVIFYHNENQKKTAISSLKTAQKNFKNKIVTEIVKEGVFYPAEEYHQKYYMKKGGSSCSL
ncbi:Peptide methionine sulfoxide reductase MsrA [Candidatus Tiddalikarchaeum anstoanum]|nr:Peptide methionine sulfoxide reductase MsrA [Candidatus Tiddalikarchaeum anstoanum]